jgi:hypothetical protein
MPDSFILKVPKSGLFGDLTGAAFVSTVAVTVGVPIGTDLAAIVLALFLDRAILRRNNTQTRFTGTFHLGNSRHA